jgi:hypothetical protein
MLTESGNQKAFAEARGISCFAGESRRKWNEDSSGLNLLLRSRVTVERMRDKQRIPGQEGIPLVVPELKAGGKSLGAI